MEFVIVGFLLLYAVLQIQILYIWPRDNEVEVEKDWEVCSECHGHFDAAYMQEVFDLGALGIRQPSYYYCPEHKKPSEAFKWHKGVRTWYRKGGAWDIVTTETEFS